MISLKIAKEIDEKPESNFGKFEKFARTENSERSRFENNFSPRWKQTKLNKNLSSSVEKEEEEEEEEEKKERTTQKNKEESRII